MTPEDLYDSRHGLLPPWRCHHLMAGTYEERWRVFAALGAGKIDLWLAKVASPIRGRPGSAALAGQLRGNFTSFRGRGPRHESSRPRVGVKRGSTSVGAHTTFRHNYFHGRPQDFNVGRRLRLSQVFRWQWPGMVEVTGIGSTRSACPGDCIG